jgi:hypothetical protein
MRAIIDTSSLISIAQYYTYFDLKDKFRLKFTEFYLDGSIVIIDRVVTESKNFRRLDILGELPFIERDKKKILDTTDILPTQKFSNQLDNSFCNKDILRKKNLDQFQYDIEKSDYLDSADAKMIIYGLSIMNENPILVTEETKFPNDGKIFAKIPFICENLKIQCCPTTTFLRQHCEMDLDFTFN